MKMYDMTSHNARKLYPADVTLVMHGVEKQAGGGPSSRVPRTVKMLNESTDYKAQLDWTGELIPNAKGIIHLFNIWDYASCEACVHTAVLHRIPVVFSPIYLDLSELPIWLSLNGIFSNSSNDQAILASLSRMRERRQKEIDAGNRYREFEPGQFRRLQAVMDKVDHCILPGKHDQKVLEGSGIKLPDTTVIYNPIMADAYANADPDLFRKKYGLDDYVLCVGRLDWRKNQVMLAYALRNDKIAVVFIAQAQEGTYPDFVKKFGGSRNIIIPKLPNDSAMLASAYAGARVFCLPSWAECPGLVNLEAGAAGCNLVLSNRSSQYEHFGDRARYCDPSDPDSIRNAVLEAWENPLTREQKDELKQHVASNFSYEKHVKLTAEVYDRVRARIGARTTFIPHRPKPVPLYVDVTHSLTYKGDVPVGFSRLEQCTYKDLATNYPAPVHFFAWIEEQRTFALVEMERLMADWQKYAKEIRSMPHSCRHPEAIFETGSKVLILGAPWFAKPEYSTDIANAAKMAKLVVAPLVADLIPIKFHEFEPDGQPEMFARALLVLIKSSSAILTLSQNSAKDIKEWLISRNEAIPPIKPIALGDDPISNAVETTQRLDALITRLGGRPFVLCVSAVGYKKNQRLLWNLWEKLAKEHGAEKIPILVCVGGPGFGYEVVKAEADKKVALKDIVYILGSIPDNCLDWLYTNCLFTVYPSFYEGWGLPVGESMRYGKICIASNAASIPEVAPSHADLLDPLNFNLWYETISEYIFNDERRKERELHVATYPHHTWKDTSREIADFLANVSLTAREVPVLNPGCEVSHFDKASQRAYLGSGWAIANMPAMATPKAALVFGTPFESEPFCFELEYKSKNRRDLLLSVNGIAYQYVKLDGDSIKLLLPAGIVDKNGRILIELHVLPPLKLEKPVMEPETFLLQSFCLRPCDEDEQLLTRFMGELGKLLPGVIAAFRSVFWKRKDLQAQYPSKEPALDACRALLWLWRYGIGEEPILGKHISEIRTIVGTLVSTGAANALTPGYSLLAEMIWKLRPDLHTLPVNTPTGQRQMLEWIRRHGREEYNLYRFVN